MDPRHTHEHTCTHAHTTHIHKRTHIPAHTQAHTHTGPHTHIPAHTQTHYSTFSFSEWTPDTLNNEVRLEGWSDIDIKTEILNKDVAEKVDKGCGYGYGYGLGFRVMVRVSFGV